jgi:hypothetical protein
LKIEIRKKEENSACFSIPSDLIIVEFIAIEDFGTPLDFYAFPIAKFLFPITFAFRS